MRCFFQRHFSMLIALLATLVSVPAVSPAGAETVVGGGYHENLTWTKANSPYRVTSDLILFPGFVLNLEPGTEVLFEDNTELVIRGEIQAIGTIDDTIRFTSTAGANPSWGGIHIDNLKNGKGTFRFVHISQAGQALGVECCGGTPEPLIVSRSRFTGNEFVSSSYSGSIAVFDSCVFEGNNTVFTSADKHITHSVFKDNRFGLSGTERVSVRTSTFIGNTVSAVQAYQSTSLDSCLITGSPVGLDGGIELSRSTVEGNDTGFIHNGVNSQAIHGNRFDNTLMNLVYRGSRALDMSGNWWGSREPAAILSKIRDARTDGDLGNRHLQPLLGRHQRNLHPDLFRYDRGGFGDGAQGILVP